MKKLLFIYALIAITTSDAAKYTVSYTREHDKRYNVPKDVALKISLLNNVNKSIRDFYVTEGTTKTVTVEEPVFALEITSPVRRDYDKFRIELPQDRQGHDYEVKFSNRWDGENYKGTIKDLTSGFKKGKDPKMKYLGQFE